MTARQEILHHAEAWLPRAVLFKPLETLPTNSPAWRLAPLFLQEVPAGDTAAVKGPVPPVYFRETTHVVRGQARPQVTYSWKSLLNGGGAGPPVGWQAIRITLDATGLPVIWEALPAADAPRLIFVSRGLEAAAQAQWGAPLPGRRWAVERAVREAPDVVVARVLDDAPVAMGPLVHLRAADARLSSVLCRCMPAQVHELAGTLYYQLHPAGAGPVSPPEIAPLRTEPPPHWPDTVPLERSLRLPGSF